MKKIIVIFWLFSTALLAQKPSIADKVYEVVQKQGIQAALAFYQSESDKQPLRFSFAESELNRLGYRFIAEQKFDFALAVLQLNHERFPNSINALDSLAEAHKAKGDKQKSIVLYKRVLKALPASGLSDENRKFLTNNARAKLRELEDRNLTDLPQEVLDFLHSGDEPFGKMHGKAPVETLQFGQLAGVWRATNFVLFQGNWISGWEGLWVWKYCLDGFAVQDLWFQYKDNLPPTYPLGRDNYLTNIRVYDANLGQWYLAWMSNRGKVGTSPAFGTFTAEMVGDDLIMTPPAVEGKPLSRIVFTDMQADSFVWRRETSKDQGASWQCTNRIEAERIPRQALPGL